MKNISEFTMEEQIVYNKMQREKKKKVSYEGLTEGQLKAHLNFLEDKEIDICDKMDMIREELVKRKREDGREVAYTSKEVGYGKVIFKKWLKKGEKLKVGEKEIKNKKLIKHQEEENKIALRRY